MGIIKPVQRPFKYSYMTQSRLANFTNHCFSSRSERIKLKPLECFRLSVMKLMSPSTIRRWTLSWVGWVKPFLTIRSLSLAMQDAPTPTYAAPSWLWPGRHSRILSSRPAAPARRCRPSAPAPPASCSPRAPSSRVPVGAGPLCAPGTRPPTQLGSVCMCVCALLCVSVRARKLLDGMLRFAPFFSFFLHYSFHPSAGITFLINEMCILAFMIGLNNKQNLNNITNVDFCQKKMKSHCKNNTQLQPAEGAYQQKNNRWRSAFRQNSSIMFNISFSATSVRIMPKGSLAVGPQEAVGWGCFQRGTSCLYFTDFVPCSWVHHCCVQLWGGGGGMAAVLASLFWSISDKKNTIVE